jgi:hypothetical protein
MKYQQYQKIVLRMQDYEADITDVVTFAPGAGYS